MTKRNYTQSLGWRNCNPLNIRYNPKNHWIGQRIPSSADKGFCHFHGRQFGYRAAFIIIRNWAEEQGDLNVRQIISKWAPSTENNTEGYIQHVCDLTGYSATTKVFDCKAHLNDNAHRVGRLFAAMTCIECGCQPKDVPYQDLCSGISMITGFAPQSRLITL